VRFGVYVSGPGIVGWLLMRTRPNTCAVFDTEEAAAATACVTQRDRPYHSVKARPYVDGDESRGGYSSHPDGYT